MKLVKNNKKYRCIYYVRESQKSTRFVRNLSILLIHYFTKNYGGSNLNRFSPYKLCEIEKIDCIISDTDIKAYLKGDYQKLHFIIAN